MNRKKITLWQQQIDILKNRYIDQLISIEDMLFNNKIEFNWKKTYPFDHPDHKIREFYHILCTNFSPQYFNLFYQNIQDLTIQLHHKQDGRYCHDIHKIYASTHHLGHELFHMASTKTRIQHGFCIQKNGILRGIGLDEGYTQILQNRYFTFVNGYFFNCCCIQPIENFIGKEKMQNCYLTCDISYLFSRLSTYIEEKQLIKFFSMLDYYTILSQKKLLMINPIETECLIENILAELHNIITLLPIQKEQTDAWYQECIQQNPSFATYYKRAFILSKLKQKR